MRPFGKINRIAAFLFAALILSLTALPYALAQSEGGRSMIAFVKADREIHDMTLSLINPATGQMVDLLNNGKFFYPVLSPDGRYIAFWGESPRKINTIFVMGTDGSNLHMLFELKRTTAIVPKSRVVWSADSKSLVYGVFNGMGAGRADGFFRINLDGSERNRISFPDLTQPFYDSWVAGSPDGTKIAFLVQQESSIDPLMMIANADGSGAHPVTTQTSDGRPIDEIAWSPDSQQTVLNTSMRNSRDPVAPLLGDADGENARNLMSPPPNYINSMSWSPDGKQITFIAPQLQSNGIPNGDLYVANADGSGLRELNIPIEVSYFGTSWSVIPDDIVLASAPISFADAELTKP
jgi:Tol biopolymer transport system component